MRLTGFPLFHRTQGLVQVQDLLRMRGEKQRHIAKHKQCLENLEKQVEAQRARLERPSRAAPRSCQCVGPALEQTAIADKHLRRALIRASVSVSDPRASRYRVACALLTRCVACVFRWGITITGGRGCLRRCLKICWRSCLENAATLGPDSSAPLKTSAHPIFKISPMRRSGGRGQSE